MRARRALLPAKRLFDASWSIAALVILSWCS